METGRWNIPFRVFCERGGQYESRINCGAVVERDGESNAKNVAEEGEVGELLSRIKVARVCPTRLAYRILNQPRIKG